MTNNTQKEINDDAAQFNSRYAEIETGIKLVREELMKQIPRLKELTSKAKKLYEYGDEKCYPIDPETGVANQIDGISNLDEKMDMLDLCRYSYRELKKTVDSLTFKVAP